MKKSPYELVYGFEPILSHLRCLCYATKINISDKVGSSYERCVLLGYSNVKKGYRLYSFDSGKIVILKEVKFFENVFPFKLAVILIM